MSIMSIISRKRKTLILLGLVALPVSASLHAQEQDQSGYNPNIVVTGQLTKGPEIKGTIVGRSDSAINVKGSDGNITTIGIDETTKIKGGSGLFGGGNKLTDAALLAGLPVTVKTRQNGEALIASQISFKKSDLRTANMIFNGTDGRFAEQTAATEALRGRVGDIDQYNVKATTNVNFAVGKATLTEQAKADLCAAATQAESMDNALLLVVGYTDSTGSQEFNQVLSEKRASAVINHLQQACGWKPYRVLTPTGMAEADPIADNTTPEGKAQNRRVAVNVLVSKAVDGL